MRDRYRLLATTTLLIFAAGVSAASGQSSGGDQHAHHKAWIEKETQGPVRIAHVLPGPEHFVGNVIYDPPTQRLWLLSFGPPANTKGPSTLFAIDPATGRVQSRATLPFLGEFGSAAYLDGYVYVIVPYESRLYKVSVAPGADFGRVASAVKLPTLSDVPLNPDDVYRFPFIAFTATIASSDGTLLAYAADLGELWTIDPASGRVLRKVQTVRGLAGATALSGPGGRPVLLATFDPVDAAFKAETRRFMFRSAHGILPLETVRAQGNYGNPGQRTVTWVLVDCSTGEVLASTAMESSRVAVGSVALVRREELPGARYGKLTALAVGDEGVLTVEWTPQ